MGIALVASDSVEQGYSVTDFLEELVAARSQEQVMLCHTVNAGFPSKKEVACIHAPEGLTVEHLRMICWHAPYGTPLHTWAREELGRRGESVR